SIYRTKEGKNIPLLVVDFGTSTTFDVVTSQGNFIGGAIAPGLATINEALASKCAQLPHVSLKRPKRAIGRTTADAIRSCVFLGYIGFVKGLIQRISKELGNKPKVIATGGLSRLIGGTTRAIHRIDPDLTLHGLRLIEQWNHEGR